MAPAETTGRTRGEPRSEEVAAACVPLLAFTAVLAAIGLVAPVRPEQLAAADPLLRLLAPAGGSWAVVALAAAISAAWLVRNTPSRAELRTGLLLSAAGAAAALAVAGLLRLVAGPSLPPFVPPEESAGPGLRLGLAAGVVEEALFRVGVLALAARWLSGRAPRWAAVAAAALLTGLLFALSHELAPGAPFVPRHFATRVIVPGVLMSLLYFKPGPAFIVSAHCAAHLAIPFLFR